MSDKILTQEEISALLGGSLASGQAVWDDDEAPLQVGPSGEVQSQEERSRSASSADRSETALSTNSLFPRIRRSGLEGNLERTLGLVFEAFSQDSDSAVAASLRTQVEMHLEGIRSLTYGDLSQALPEPASIWTLKLNPLDLDAAVCLESKLVHGLVDLLMGGDGSAPKDDRPITELDQSVLQSLVEVLCRQFSKAWSRVIDVQVALERRETRPSLLQLYSSAEAMVQVEIDVAAGAAQGRIHWAIPGAMLAQSKRRFESQGRRSGQNAAQALQALQEVMAAMPTHLEAVIPGSGIRVEDLLALSAGDVVKLDHPVDRPIEVRVNGMVRHQGRLVSSRGRRAVQLVEKAQRAA